MIDSCIIVKSSQVKSSQVKSSQVKSSQVKSTIVFLTGINNYRNRNIDREDKCFVCFDAGEVFLHVLSDMTRRI